MKKFAKIFVAVAALFTGVACTTDVTDDLGVQLGDGVGQTTVTLSLEESRTSLGAETNGLYPVIWSSDDAISINGVKSSSIAVAQNAATATFTFNSSLSYPYCVAYPAATEGKVLFADQQSYTDGTFVDGAAAMYGYAESNGGVTLHHLTGVLKIGVVGSKTLTYAQISTADRAPIAGEFDIDFTTGEVTPTEGSKEVIGYSFPEDLVLASVPQYIHVAVPAGQYDELYVTLYDTEGGVMYATVKAGDSKPLTAGKVREFVNDIPYEANASVFVVKDKTSLQAFAAEAASLNKNVLFVADVDMTGETWTPIEGYKGIVLGNGYAIKGLTAPLFGTIDASIKGLHLRDVNIHETVNPNVGALARVIDATTGLLKVEHCSVTGSILIDCPNKTHNSGDSQYRPYSAGSLIGATYGVELSDCWSDTEFEVKQIIATSNTDTIYPCIGGVVGNVNEKQIGDVTHLANVTNLENKGDVIFADYSYTGTTNLSTYSKVIPYVGGVAGSSATANAAIFKNIVNRGDVTLKGNFGNGVRLSGTFGNITTSLGSHFYNYGKVTVADGDIRYIYMGGGVGHCGSKTALENVHNYGAVEVSKDAFVPVLVCGGLMGYQSSGYVERDAGHSYIKDSSNNAPVSVFCKTLESNTAHSTAYYRVGGLAGWTQHLIVNCNNNEKGVVTCRGRVHNEDTSNYSVCIAGLVGYKTVNAIDESYNKANVICDVNLTKGPDATWDTTSGDKTTTNVYDVTKVRMNLGGIAGYSNLPCRDVVNHGDIIVSGSYDGQLRVGGVIGHVATTSGSLPSNSNCVNHGAVIVKENTPITDMLEIGGCFGFASKIIDATNNGAVTIESGVSVGGNAYIGGVFGYQNIASSGIYNTGVVTVKKNADFKSELYVAGGGAFANADISNIENLATGTVNIEDIEIAILPHFAGALAFASAITTDGKAQSVKKIDGIINRGAVNVNVNTDKNIIITVGGCIGEAAEGSYTGQSTLRNATVSNIANYGPVTVTSTDSYNYYIGGLGYFIGGPLTNGINHETGTVNVNVVTRSNISVGGLAYKVKDTATDSHNKATVTIEGDIAGTTYIAGSIVTNNNYTRTRTNNEGDVIVKAMVRGSCFVGGMVYDSGAKMRYVDCHNSGNLTLAKEATVVGNVRWGGLVGKLEGTDSASDPKYNIFDGCSNSGDILIQGTVQNYLRLGGLIGSYQKNYPFIILNGFTNSGDIINEGTMTSTSYIQMGGVFGFTGSGESNKVTCYPTYSNDTYPEWTGDVINTGKVIYRADGKGPVRLGGIFGGFDSTTPNTGSFINLGDITLEGTHAGDSSASGVGGITGDIKGNYTLDNIQVFCNIRAIGIKRVGMVLGSTRSSKKYVTNCKIGGTLCNSQAENDDTKQMEDVVTTISAENFMNYIYGTADWTGVENYDGCSFLTSKDAITYTPAAETPAE